MLISCTTKGCMQLSEAKLDKDTKAVVCDVCGNEITNITSFTKKTLEVIGQVTKTKKQPFQQHCNICKKDVTLFVQDEKAHCKQCATQIPVTAAFLQGLKLYLNEKAKEEKVEKAEKTKNAKK